VANAHWHGRTDFSDFQRFSISVGGGFGFSEGHQGMLDLKTELQFGLTSRIRLGLGVGFINGEGRYGFGKDWDDRPEGVEADQFVSHERNGKDSQMRGYGRDFRIIPLSLNVYYALPLGHRWNIFVSGGGSYYFGSFHAMDVREHKNAWGGQGGLGIEFRLARQLRLVAEGSYRFAEFRGLKQLQPKDPMPLTESAADSDCSTKEWGDRSHMDFNGFSFRTGVKFGF
jgi:uncharacterized protein YfiM (DUF2279 family)